jgi:hypothetical protein
VIEGGEERGRGRERGRGGEGEREKGKIELKRFTPFFWIGNHQVAVQKSRSVFS